VRSTIFLAVAILLVLGIVFARDRVRLAFQVGAVLYAISLAVRFVIFGAGDDDNLVALLTVAAFFFLLWLAAKTAVDAVLRRRARERGRGG
jgi:cytochrome c biogenesis factor